MNFETKRIGVLLVLLFLIVYSVEANSRNRTSIRNCNRRNRPNEVFSRCRNNKCQNTCRNPAASVGCTENCVPGCECATGYLRNSKRVCVLPDQCDPKPACGVNEVFSNCGNDGCRPTCDRLNVGICIPNCVNSGCICAPGYVRNSANVCVLPSQCPSVPHTTICTRANERFSHCGNDGCQPSCGKINVGLCIPQCSIAACVCNVGFVRNAAGDCVLPSQCPTVPPITCTRANERYSQCGNDGCRPSCSKINVGVCIPHCSIPACVCVDGFVRNAAGDCVLPSQCPAPSPCVGANQMFSNCGDDGCQRTCTRQTVTNCNSVCSNPGCVCQNGFVRNSVGECVNPSQCPTTPVCRANEQFSTCGNNNCQATCANPTPTGCIPNPTCVPGCICSAGFLKNYLGMCVSTTQCSACSPSEVFKTCSNGVCEGTCATPGLPSSGSCNTSGACISRCFCNTGLVRNSAGVCVPRNTC